MRMLKRMIDVEIANATACHSYGVFQTNAVGNYKHLTPNGVENTHSTSKNDASKRDRFDTLAPAGSARP